MIPPLVALALLRPPSDGQWAASALPATTLANRVDAALAGMRNTKLSFEYAYLQGGNQGFMKCEASILGPGRYWMQVPNVDRKRKRQIFRERWISDGKRFGRAEEPDPVKPRALSTRPPAPAQPLARWFDDFSRTVMLGLATSTHPFSSLLADARRTGYRTVAEQRQFSIGGKTVRQYRMVVTKGAARYEIDIDGRYLLPTGIVNYVGATDNTRWSAVRWSHTRKPLDSKILEFRRPGKTTILSPAPRPR